MQNNLEQWEAVKADLARARGALPETDEAKGFVSFYEDFIDHIELVLACDTLEDYALNHEMPRDFWLVMRDAAVKMRLQDYVNRYEEKLETLKS